MADETSAKKAALRGLVQGATFGFGDEAGGAEQAGLNTLAKHLPKGLGDALGIETRYPEGLDKSGDVYTKARNEERAEDKAAEDAHPVVYNASEIAGGLIPGMAGGLGSGARAGKAAANIAAKRYATTAAEAGAKRFAEAAAKKAALQSMMRTGAVQGAVSTYGHGERDGRDLGNIGDMIEGAASGVGGAYVGHELNGLATAAKGAMPSVSAAFKKYANPAKTAKSVFKQFGGEDEAYLRKMDIDKAADEMSHHYEFNSKDPKTGLSNKETVAGVRALMKKNGVPPTQQVPTKGLDDQAKLEAIGKNFGYNDPDLDFGDLLDPTKNLKAGDGATPVVAPPSAELLEQAKARNVRDSKRGK